MCVSFAANNNKWTSFYHASQQNQNVCKDLGDSQSVQFRLLFILRTVVRGNFNIHGTKNFQDAVFHQKSKIYDFSSILNLQLRFLSPFLMKKKIFEKKKIAGKILILIFFNFSLLQWVQGFQALILVIIKGFQAFRVQRLEFRGYLERRFYVIFQS